MIKKLKMILPVLSLTLLLTPGMTGLAAQTPTSDYTTVVASVKDEGALVPMSDDIRWVYKTMEDGHRYKRLFNYSTNQWVGDWILVS